MHDNLMTIVARAKTCAGDYLFVIPHCSTTRSFFAQCIKNVELNMGHGRVKVATIYYTA